MKLFITPSIKDSPYGVRRVIEAMHRYLPQFGVEITDNPEEADVISYHGTSFTNCPGKPAVAHSHGLFWQELPWPDMFLEANQWMIDNMVKAQAITVPSQWVRHAITRGILRSPCVVHHGVDIDEWTPGENYGFVLWNKARADVVSNPDDLDKIAAQMPDVGFVTTIGNQTSNVQVVGALEHHVMKDAVRKAGVYLATARETFGIGTLEALSCGVPIAGWDWGGQREIVIQGETGYLAPYGDYKALEQCIRRCVDERDRLSQNARSDAVKRWQWVDKIEQYANIFKQVYWRWNESRPKVSVIVTDYNLAHYLNDCLSSVQQQTLQDFECIVIDDSSTDNSYEVALPFMKDGRFRYICTPQNLGLSGARNYGFKQASGNYIIYLDADDKFLPNALSLLANGLDNNPGLGIAYGHLDLMNDDGTPRLNKDGNARGDWPFAEFNWHGQLAHLNQLAYCAMMRREVMESSGGYRRRDWRAEDASFWCRVTTLGWRAGKVTDESTLIYRVRSDSKGAMERAQGYGDGDWTSWYPWRLGASTAQEGFELMQQGKQPPYASVPFGAQGKSPRHCWPVWSHHDPLVSIIIPVGPKHTPYLVDALDSVQAQTFPFWEVIVVNDTGQKLDVSHAPFAKLVDNGTHNIADSRNKGIEAAKAPLIIFLDCDDLLIPAALQDMIVEYIKHDGSKYIYTDWYGVRPGHEPEQQGARDYIRDGRGIHPISTLIPREWCLAVGGFDNEIQGWEDWDFCVKLQIKGYCGVRLPKPLLVYRLHSGERREESLEKKGMSLPKFKERYGDYYPDEDENGQPIPPEKEMAGCCGGNGDTILKAKADMGLIQGELSQGKPIMSDGSGMVRIEYIGSREGYATYNRVNGVSLRIAYELGNDTVHRYADAFPEDAKLLVEAGIARYVRTETIDLLQAQVPQFNVPDVDINRYDGVSQEEASFAASVLSQFQHQQEDVIQVPQEPEPEWALDIQGQALADMNLTNFRLNLVGKTVDELKQIRSLEVMGKNRKGALSSIDELLADALRVS